MSCRDSSLSSCLFELALIKLLPGVGVKFAQRHTTGRYSETGGGQLSNES